MPVIATMFRNSEYKYPIEQWTKRARLFDCEIKIFDIAALGDKISKPADIATLQNKYLKTIDNKDWVLWIQADVMIRKEMIPWFKEYFVKKEKNHSYTFDIRHIHGFYLMSLCPFGITLIGKDAKAHFIGDGAYPESYNVCNGLFGYDVGRLGNKNLQLKNLNHSRIWNSTTPEQPNGLMVYQGDYAEIINDFELQAEYKNFLITEANKIHQLLKPN